MLLKAKEDIHQSIQICSFLSKKYGLRQIEIQDIKGSRGPNSRWLLHTRKIAHQIYYLGGED